jgi:hypothetical protein
MAYSLSIAPMEPSMTATSPRQPLGRPIAAGIVNLVVMHGRRPVDCYAVRVSYSCGRHREIIHTRDLATARAALAKAEGVRS